MTQYPHMPPGQSPQPYFPPGYGGPALHAPSPARRAGMLLMVIGVFGLMCGGFCAIAAKNWDFIMANQPPDLRANMPVQANAQTMLYEAEVILGLAFLLLGSGIAVRRGNRASIIIALILTCLLALYFLLGALSGLLLTAKGNGMGVLVLIMCGFIAVVFCLAVMWLIQSLNTAPQMQQSQAAYQAQYWQYLQQQQAYQASLYQQYGPNAYNAPPSAPAQGGIAATGWQMPAQLIPPPPPPPTLPNSPGDDSKAGGPST